MTPYQLFQKLHTECHRLGGKLIPVKGVVCLDDPDISHAPFDGDIAINWGKKEIYFDPSMIENTKELAGIIHEMGHVFLDVDFLLDKDEGKLEEIDFLGWEYAMARRIGCVSAWFADNDNYCIHRAVDSIDKYEFGALNKNERRRLLRKFVRLAEKRGYIVDGVPVAKR